MESSKTINRQKQSNKNFGIINITTESQTSEFVAD